MSFELPKLHNLYQKYLGRNAGQEGIDFWKNDYAKIGWEGIENNIKQSEEAKKYQQSLQASGGGASGGGASGGGVVGNDGVYGNVMNVLLEQNGSANGDLAQKWAERIRNGTASLDDLRSSLSGGASEPVAPAPAPPQTSVSNQQTSQGQLNDILASDSPLMQRAASQGMQIANSRGLLNSSMASAASQGAMIDRASPLARQDAQTHFQNSQANADRRQQAYLSNLQYQQSLGLNEQQHGFQAGLNEQQHGFDLDRLQASSMANAWGVMANSVTDIVAQAMQGISNIQANPNIKPDDKTAMIDQILEMRDSDIQFQGELYESLSSYLADTGLFPNL